MLFREKLRDILVKKYGTISRAAETMNIKQPQLSAYLNGRREPGFKFFLTLAQNDIDLNEAFSITPMNYIAKDGSAGYKPSSNISVDILVDNFEQVLKAIQHNNIKDPLEMEDLIQKAIGIANTLTGYASRLQQKLPKSSLDKSS